MSKQTLPRDLYEVAVDDVAYDLINAASNTSSNKTGRFHRELVDHCKENLSDKQLLLLIDRGHGEFDQSVRNKILGPNEQVFELTIEEPFWVDQDGNLLKYLDYPTDGPMFREFTADGKQFTEVQFESDEFRELVREGSIEKYEWAFEVHHDGTMDAGRCPYCGKDNHFDCNFSVGKQMLGSPRCSLDEQQGEMHADDYFDIELTFARCGHCQNVVYDDDD